MNFFEKMMSPKTEKTGAEEVENKVEVSNVEKDIEDLKSTVEEMNGIDPEKAAKNIEKNEELRNKLKIAAGILTTIGFGAAMVLAFTERADMTDIVKNVPGIVQELILGASFLATAVSGGLTQAKMEKVNNDNYKKDHEENTNTVAA